MKSAGFAQLTKAEREALRVQQFLNPYIDDDQARRLSTQLYGAFIALDTFEQLIRE